MGTHEGLANSKGEWGRGGGLIRSHNIRTNQEEVNTPARVRLRTGQRDTPGQGVNNIGNRRSVHDPGQ